MPEATFKLSAFGDEIASDLEEQLRVLTDLEVYHLDLRNAWDINVVDLDGDQAQRVRDICDDYGVTVACLGSPIGKSPIEAPIEEELARLERLIEVGQIVGCRRVRMFSFYPPDTSTNEHYNQYVDSSIDRLRRLTELAEEAGFVLLHENEKHIVGDTIARCTALIRGVDSPAFRFLWDPANFVQVGEERPTEDGWSLLGDEIGYVHVKDARLEDGSVCAAGEGDGQIEDLLIRLQETGYQGVLALEPHLERAGERGGFSGPEKMAYAVEKLRALMDDVGCTEKK